MKKYFSDLLKNDLFYVLLMLVAAAISYLLFARRLGFGGDDWYIIFDAHTQGRAFLHVVFASDRPARAYLLSLAYHYFGDHLIYYHLSAFLFRYISALALYWTLNMVWAGKRQSNFLISLLFLIYPGFLMQIQPVDYQSHIVSCCLAMVSIALTVYAVYRKNRVVRILLWVLAGIVSLIYLSQIEFFVGMEFLRLFFVGVACWQAAEEPLRAKVVRTIKNWFPFVLAPAGFLVWRVFFFKATRVTTDVGLLAGSFASSPVHGILQWSLNLLYSLYYSILSAWITPFTKILVEKQLSIRDNFVIFLLALIVAAGIVAGLWKGRKDVPAADEKTGGGWIPQALWGGFLTALAGLIPIIISDRTANYDNSRFALVIAPSVAMMVVAGLYSLNSHRLRMGLIGLIVFLSISTHLGNAISEVHQADALRNFWWQVSWRAPSIEAGTDLMASYYLMETPENYDVWGPANLIYFPAKQTDVPIKIPLPASMFTDEVVTGILGHGPGRDMNVRGNFVHEDYTALLVMTQPAPGSCVRILDGKMPELSPFDPNEVKLVAPFSRIGNVNNAATSPVPPVTIFGLEPAHAWCYYYEKASLARQMGDWPTVIALGSQARGLDLAPADPIEWIPFLQAYVATGDLDALAPFEQGLAKDPLTRMETCQILKSTTQKFRPDDPAMSDFIDQKICP